MYPLRKWLWAILLFVAFQSPAQMNLRNAYEISIGMYTAANSRAPFAERKAVNKQVLSSLVWYLQVDGYEQLGPKIEGHRAVVTHIDRMSKPLKNIDTLFRVKLETLMQMGRLKDYDPLVVKIRAHRALTTLKESVLMRQAELNTETTALGDSIKVVTDMLKDTSISGEEGLVANLNARLRNFNKAIERNTDELTEIATRLDSIARKHKSIKEEVRTLVLTPNAYIDVKREYLEGGIDSGLDRKDFDLVNMSAGNLSLSENASALDRQIQIQVDTRSSGGGFRMPGQAEMIDAMAVYLAKRVKQEAVLWFFETLKKNAGTDELIRTCFPESIALLYGMDGAEVPNLGSNWRYAMSKDFLTLPENLFTSNWLAKNVPQEHHYILRDIKLAITISRLMQQNYTYHEMIRYLYLNNLNAAELASTANGLITFLYCVNQEMVKSHENSAHLLSYEEMLAMPPDAFCLMVELMDIKYDGVISAIFGDTRYLGDQDYRKRFIGYLGRLQLVSQKLDKVKAQYQSMLKDDGKSGNGNSFTYLSPWKFVSELLAVLQPDSSLIKSTGNFTGAFKRSIGYLIRVQDVFENLQQKNYSGAVKLTIDIVESMSHIERSYASGTSAERLYDLLSQPYAPGSAVFNGTGRAGKVPRYWYANWKDIYAYKQEALRGISIRQELKDFLNRNSKMLKEDGIAKLAYQDSANITALIDTPMIRVLNGGLKLPLHKGETIGRQDLRYLVERDATLSLLADENKSGWTAERYDRAIKYVGYYTNSSFFRTKDIVLRLAGFLNDVALTSNSAQLSQVVEAYAMPAGSYKRKRNAWYSVDLNAYVGPYLGYEYPIKSTKQPGWVYGLSAPIGITYTKLIGRRVNSRKMKEGEMMYKSSYHSLYRKSRSTFSLGFSIVDIGAVVSYRLSNSDGSVPQQFKWEQFLSPGLHFSYGIPGTPLAWNFSAIYSPRIRKFEDATHPEKQYNTYRLQTGIFFDLPLMNVWERKTIMRCRKYRVRPGNTYEL